MSYIWACLKNKYFLTFVGLTTWLLFFDKYDLGSQIELTQKLNELKEEKAYFQSEIQQNKQDMLELKTNPVNLEKFAREKYLMKKENEEIFILVPRNPSPSQASQP